MDILIGISIFSALHDHVSPLSFSTVTPTSTTNPTARLHNVVFVPPGNPYTTIR